MPKAHYSEHWDKIPPLQIMPLKVNFKLNWRINFSTLGTNGLIYLMINRLLTYVNTRSIRWFSEWHTGIWTSRGCQTDRRAEMTTTKSNSDVIHL